VVPEADTTTQTDAFLDRPPTPQFVPTKSGTDAATQIEQGEKQCAGCRPVWYSHQVVVGNWQLWFKGLRLRPQKCQLFVYVLQASLAWPARSRCLHEAGACSSSTT
jgi:hypothetical protein